MTTPTTTLADRTALLVGGSSGIGRRLAADLAGAGAAIAIAGRDTARLAPTVESLRPTGAAVQSVRLDLADETTIAAAAEHLGTVDHVVVLAADHANGPVAELDADAITGAFAAKVTGPILLAKHLGARINPGGSMLLFCGVAAWKPAPGLTVMATANGAVSFLAEALAVELAPVRVNALSPGIVDSGAWDAMGGGKQAMFDATAARNPVRRVGTPADISAAAIALLTNGFITGATLHVDGGGRFA